ncbi:MAG: hypothetical protein ACXWV2_02815 [Chitinophagaceae bacterium]
MNILSELTKTKNLAVHKFILDFLGREPNPEDKKNFMVKNSLTECEIYFKGELVKVFTFQVKDDLEGH